MLSSMPLFRFFLIALFALPAGLNARGAEPVQADDPLSVGKAALRNGDFDLAAQTLAEAPLPEGGPTDELIYFQALANFYAGRFDQAMNLADRLAADHEDSVWLVKAKFLKARGLVELRRFAEAEAIYAAEAARLLSQRRKHEIAGVLVEFADALATRPSPTDVGAPPANFAKAYELYGKVLEMEIGRGLRDKVSFRRARAALHGEDYAAAIEHARSYLAAFDPSWTGAVGSPRRVASQRKTETAAAGEHIWQSRLLLAKAQRLAGQNDVARTNLTDLLTLLGRRPDNGPPANDSAALAAAARWQLVLTYGMPTPQLNRLAKAIEAAQGFLTRHPQHPRAVQAAWFIGAAYRHHGRADRAIAALEKFIDRDGFDLPQGDSAGEKLADLGKSPAELWDERRKQALYQIGEIRQSQNDFDAAIDAWSKYVNQFPSGSQWAAAQQGIIDAEFARAVEAVGEGSYKAAKQQFGAFLSDYPLDARAAHILFALGQFDFVRAQELAESQADAVEVERVYRQAIERWQRLVSKYPQTEPAALALYRIGLIYEEELQDYEAALEAYRRLSWGSTAVTAAARVAALTEKHLTLTTERKFRTNETARVKLDVRNIRKLTVKQYSLDLESYFRKTHAVGRVDALDVDLIQPDKTWEVEVDDYQKYATFEQEVEIPFEADAPGVCIVRVGDDDQEATTLVVRSDLDLIVKSSRRELLVFVQDRLRNEPARGVNLLMSDGTGVFAEGVTGDDGVYRGKFEQLASLATVSVFAHRDGQVASHAVNLEGLQRSRGLANKGYLYADRPAYQPGQIVQFRGVIRNVRNGSYVAPAGVSYQVGILDVQGRTLWEQDMTLSEFGSFSGRMTLDHDVPVGQYTLIAREAGVGENSANVYSTKFSVQKYQLENLRLQLTTDRDVYFRGEQVKLTVAAEYYWGQPAGEKSLRVSLPDGRTAVGETDEAGQWTMEVDTTGLRPGTRLGFTATIDGEDVSGSHTAFLAEHGFRIDVKTTRPLVLAGEPIDVDVETRAADGSPVGRELTVSVLRRALAPNDPVLAGVPWMQARSRPAAEKALWEQRVTTDENTGAAHVTLDDPQLQGGGVYIVRVSGRDRFQQMVSQQASIKVSDDDDDAKLRLFADSDQLLVGQGAAVRIHSRVDAPLALVTLEGESIISHRLVALQRGFNPIELAIDHEHFPNFRLAVAVMDGHVLREATKPFQVQRTLNVVVRPAAEVYAPGAAAKVRLQVTDQLNRPVRGEFSLSLVDAALLARYPDQTPPIREFFQADAQRFAEFRAASSCGFRYVAKTTQASQEYLEELARMSRSEVGDLALSTVQPNFSTWGYAEAAANAAASGPEYRDADRQQMGATAFDRSAPASPSPDAWMALSGRRSRAAGVELDEGVQSRHMLQRRALELGRSPADQNSAEALIGADRSGETQPRAELPSAGWWAPQVITDSEGQARVEIPLPESTSEWRLTARGVTVETLAGDATAKLVTRRDFFVTLKSPRTLREGDSLQVLARVHNLTDFAGPVNLTLVVRGGAELEQQVARRTVQIRVDGQSVAEGLFDAFDAPQLPQLRLEVRAEAGELRDAVARMTPIRPWGLEFADSDGGRAQGNAMAVVELPGDRDYGAQWLTVSVGPNFQRSLIDAALGAAPGPRCVYPAPTPWGRSTASELLAAAAALEYAQRVNAPAADSQRLARRARSLVTALVVSQRDDGGWSPRAGQKESQWANSARSFWALCAAKRLGVTVDDQAFNKGQQYLQRVFSTLDQADNDAKAVVLHALSCNDAADFAHLNRLHRQRNRISASALAYTALAMSNLGRQEFAGELLEVLSGHVVIDGDQAYWKGAERHARLSDEVETTAVVLLALTEVSPQSEHAAPAVRFLLARRGVWGFVPANAHGPAIRALCAHFGQGQYAANDLTIDVLINGRKLTTLASAETDQTVLLSAPAELLKSGKNQVEFRVAGRGEFAYAASLRGFSRDLSDPESWQYPEVRRRRYRHAPLEYRGRDIGVASTSPVENIEIGQRVRVDVSVYHPRHDDAHYVVEEHVPVGMMVVEGSLAGGFDHYEIDDQRIVMHFGQGRRVSGFTYEMVGRATGRYRALPTVVRDLLRPERMRLGKPATLIVLRPDEESADPYELNDRERFVLGKLHFEDGLYREAATHLSHLFKYNRRYNQRDVARMLLWIYTAEQFYDAQQVVDVFEVLRERFPTLQIPFDKIVAVARAYRDIGEYERALQVNRAVISASFVNDSSVSAVLEDEGQFLASIDYQENLWREYPDAAEVVAAHFALSQALYQKAPEAHLIADEQRRIAISQGDERPQPAPTKMDMLRETVRLLSDFTALYPQDPLADDAAFSMANALLDLKQYQAAVEACHRFGKRFVESDFQSGFQYMIALGHFWLRQHEQALAAAKAVASGNSDDRDLARYIVGQIYHAESQPEQAIAWYEKISQEYPDAQHAIDYFQEQRVALEEINVFRPGDNVELTLDYRNIAEAGCQVYAVDLMRLYLREKSLANITKVNLAGIHPLIDKTMPLGDGKDYVDKQHKIQLELEAEGAYLVICRGDDLFTSALVLITPLEMEVQEDQQSGQLRANVMDAATDQYVAEVHVKAIGSADDDFRAGETDLRGVFVAENLQGKATVIARDGQSRYAFYRGDAWLGAQPDSGSQQAQAPAGEGGLGGGGFGAGKTDYQQNLRTLNDKIQSGNYIQFDQWRRGQTKGVEVQKAQ